MANGIKIKVNGLTHGVSASLDTPLLYVLHNELHLHGPRFGCGLAQCGACSVLLDGKEIRSCVTPVAAVSGKSITTLEGLPALWASQRGTTDAAPALHPLQQAWIDVQVPQCGYCQNGMLIQAADLLGTTKSPSVAVDQGGDERASVPLWHLHRDHRGDPDRRQDDGEGSMTMSAIEENRRDHDRHFGATLTRSRFVKGAGAMVVGLSFVGVGAKAARADVFGPPQGPSPCRCCPAWRIRSTRRSPSSWFTINADNTIMMRTGIPEMGQGSASTAFAQIAADELNVPYSAITQVIIGDTDRTLGGGIAAGYMALGAPNIRKVAAYIYQSLLSMASTAARRARSRA